MISVAVNLFQQLKQDKGYPTVEEWQVLAHIDIEISRPCNAFVLASKKTSRHDKDWSMLQEKAQTYVIKIMLDAFTCFSRGLDKENLASKHFAVS